MFLAHLWSSFSLINCEPNVCSPGFYHVQLKHRFLLQLWCLSFMQFEIMFCILGGKSFYFDINHVCFVVHDPFWSNLLSPGSNRPHILHGAQVEALQRWAETVAANCSQHDTEGPSWAAAAGHLRNPACTSRWEWTEYQFNRKWLDS